MNWFAGKIKFIFWSLMTSSIISILISFSPKSRSVLQGALQQLKYIKEQKSAANTNVPEALQIPEAPHLDNQNLSQQVANKVDSIKDAAKKIIEDNRVSSSANEYRFHGENYVLIKGKYYKARPDNTYLVDGEKVFFINNRRVAQAAEQGGSNNYVPNFQGPSADVNFGNMAVPPQELIKNYQKTQDNLRSRNAELEKIDYNH